LAELAPGEVLLEIDALEAGVDVDWKLDIETRLFKELDDPCSGEDPPKLTFPDLHWAIKIFFFSGSNLIMFRRASPLILASSMNCINS
jgi:hypothetical protein